MYDLVITQGRVFDGFGAPARKYDIALKGERIVALGNLTGKPARKKISIPGLHLAPGFIDIHSHSDVYYLAHPPAECKIRQGVTTEVIGNCGASAAPLLGSFRKHRQKQWQPLGIKVNWKNFTQYIKVIRDHPTTVNIVPLVGQGNLRAAVKGFSSLPLTRKEKHNLAGRLIRDMDTGAWGMSSGLIYRPSMYAGKKEIIELCRIVAGYGGLYTTHIRGEGDHAVSAVQEAVDVARESGVNTQISHLKVSGKKNWPKLNYIFQIIEQAQQRGASISCDRYPYLAGNSDLDIILPDNAPACNDRELINHLTENMPAGWADQIVIGQIRNSKYKWAEGKSINEIAQRKHRSAEEMVITLLRAADFQVQAMFFGMNEKNLLRILKKPYVMVGSDSSLRTTHGPLAFGHPHPRVFGTFPRILARYTGPGKLSFAEAIHKMTALPARTIGLKQRGSITTGNYADLVIFDKTRIKDRATYAKPFQYPTGIEFVIINGEIVFRNNQLTGSRPGKVLLRT